MESQITELKEQIENVKAERNRLRTECETANKYSHEMRVENHNHHITVKAVREENESLKKANKDFLLKNEVLHQKVEELLTAKCELTTGNIYVRENLLKEKEKTETNQGELERLRKENQELNKRNQLNAAELIQYYGLVEKIAHFAAETLTKKDDLPVLGQNNTEELEMQKFVNFILHHTKQLEAMVPNGLNRRGGECSLCHKTPEFAKCTTEGCGSVFHKDCIENWFKTRKECPCCHKDSVETQDSSNSV